MPGLVKIVHPLVGESMVPEQSVGHWANAGWRLASEAKAEQQEQLDSGGEPPPAEPANNDGPAEPVVAENRPRRRRGAQKEGEV